MADPARRLGGRIALRLAGGVSSKRHRPRWWAQAEGLARGSEKQRTLVVSRAPGAGLGMGPRG